MQDVISFTSYEEGIASLEVIKIRAKSSLISPGKVIDLFLIISKNQS